MSKAMFVAANVAFIIIFGLIANELGFASQTIELPQGEILAPENSNIFERIIAPFVWAWEAASVFFQLLEITFFGVNQLVFLLVFGPLLMVDAFIVYGMVRGGGT